MKRKNKKIVRAIIILLLLGLSIRCYFANARKVKMTDEEKTILCSAYNDDERINGGILRNYEYEALKQFRACKLYLKEKYPGYDYDFCYFSPSNKYHNFTILKFTIKDSEETFTVKVRVGERKYTITDDFFGYVLSPRYNEFLAQKLDEIMDGEFVVYARFSGYVGKSIDANTTLEEIIAKGDKLKININVVVNSSDVDDNKRQKIAKEIELYLKSIGNYGCHTIYFGTDIVKSCSTWDEFVEFRKNNVMESVDFDTGER